MRKVFLVCISSFEQSSPGPKNAEMFRIRESVHKAKALMMHDGKVELKVLRRYRRADDQMYMLQSLI